MCDLVGSWSLDDHTWIVDLPQDHVTAAETGSEWPAYFTANPPDGS